jgi:hypothetical protein
MKIKESSSGIFCLLGPPRKSFWIILRLVFFFFAIEFMYAVETALTIPILSALRVPESYVVLKKKNYSLILHLFKGLFNGLDYQSNSRFFPSTRRWYVE